MTDEKNTDAAGEEFTDISDLVAADGEKDTLQVYELGYHILPTVAEDALDAEVAALGDILKQASAEMVGERAPVSIDLAYGMDKKIEGKRQTFNSAYFGWVAFEVAGSNLKAIDEAVAANENVLRHLIVKTDRDAVAATLADPRTDFGLAVDEPEVEGADAEEGDESQDTPEDKEGE